MMLSTIPWNTQINFASALLLHSCLTVLVKESLNCTEIARRLTLRFLRGDNGKNEKSTTSKHIGTSIVLDAYTSIFSKDLDGDLSELYFTNTGVVLLAITLASSVAMNLFLDALVLNMVVASTFGVAWIASLAVGRKEITLPIMALRRAGRFIWSDTPFVNFFSLIYIGTVLHGQATLRLQDYVTFRAIAVLELVFMKARLAAADPEKQVELLRRLVGSEFVLLNEESAPDHLLQPFPKVQRNNVVTFCSMQRMSVMLVKTSIGYHNGCLQGPLGPAMLPLPSEGHYIDDIDAGWRLYRLLPNVMVLADCLMETKQSSAWKRFCQNAHGWLLRSVGKVRVVYVLRTDDKVGVELWHSNINLVTGVAARWLRENFEKSSTEGVCIVAGH